MVVRVSDFFLVKDDRYCGKCQTNYPIKPINFTIWRNTEICAIRETNNNYLKVNPAGGDVGLTSDINSATKFNIEY